jgi:hypothetical protein
VLWLKNGCFANDDNDDVMGQKWVIVIFFKQFLKRKGITLVMNAVTRHVNATDDVACSC